MSSTTLRHAVVVTATDTADGSAVGELLHCEEVWVWGYKAYDGLREAIGAAAPSAENDAHDKGYPNRPVAAE